MALYIDLSQRIYLIIPTKIKKVFLSQLHFLCQINFTYLTYLCGHNNPIIGFQPAIKLRSRRLYFARASSSWLHHLKSEPLQPGLSNGYAVVPPADGHQAPHQTLLSEEHLHPSERHGSAGSNRWLLIRLAT